jgi:hypothetical protein
MLEYNVRDTDLLFTAKVATRLSRNNFRTKFWVDAVTKAKVEQKVTFHKLRAAHASWLLAGRVDIVSVQERLRHAASPPPSSCSAQGQAVDHPLWVMPTALMTPSVDRTRQWLPP